MQIHHTSIHQILLYRFDDIPRSRIIQKRVLAEISALFEFSEVQVDENRYAIAQAGIFRDEGNEYPINRLVIEERRILLDMEAKSTNADLVISKLCQLLGSLTNRVDTTFLQPILKAEESEIIARMEFPFHKLISPKLLKLLKSEALPAMSLDLAQAVITPFQLTFLVQYRTEGLELDDYRILLNRKDFLIGPRPGFPITDQLYYSKAPLNTKSHLELLSNLEEMFK